MKSILHFPFFTDIEEEDEGGSTVRIHSSDSNDDSDRNSDSGEEVEFDIQLPYQHLVRFLTSI